MDHSFIKSVWCGEYYRKGRILMSQNVSNGTIDSIRYLLQTKDIA